MVFLPDRGALDPGMLFGQHVAKALNKPVRFGPAARDGESGALQRPFGSRLKRGHLSRCGLTCDT